MSDGVKSWRITRRGLLGGVGVLTLAAVGSGAVYRSRSATPDCRLADAVSSEGDAAYLWIDPASVNPADPPARITVQVGDAPAQPLRWPVAGVHRIAGLPTGRAVTIRVGVETAAGRTASVEVGEVTATRHADTHFACWADGFDHAPLSAPVGAVAAAAGETPAVQGPVRLHRQPGDRRGGEIEYTGGPAPFVASYRHDRAPAAPAPMPPIRRRHYEPLGAFDDLSPCAAAQVTFAVAGAAQPGDVTVLGAAGMATRRAVATVGLDPEGDPVSFRFDRPVQVGRLPDGRPFAVGPLRILRNAGAPVAVDPAGRGFAVIARDGAQLCVLARPGLVPPPVPTAAPDFAPGYRRHDTAYDFAAAGWNERAVRIAPDDGLVVSASWESIAVFFDSPDPGTVSVRFREVGERAFHPALPLLFDDRDHASFATRRVRDGQAVTTQDGPLDMRAAVRGRHRRTIRHLAPDTPYEIQIRQGDVYRRAFVRTDTYKPRKQTVALGTVHGDVTVRRAGGTVHVERAGQAPLRIDVPPSSFVELHAGRVLDGCVTVQGPRIILRDIDVHGAPEDAIRIGAGGAEALRLVRCRGASWGWATTPETGFPGGLGFARNNTSWLTVTDEAGDVDDVLVIGCEVGAPRFSANTWQELDTAYPEERHFMAAHPFGANAIGIRPETFMGRGWNVRDCVMRAVGTRLYDDGVRGRGNSAFDGGVGIEFVFAYNAVGGAADDSVEFEGANICNLILANHFDQTRLRRWTTAPHHAIGCTRVMWGPLECERNLIEFGAFDGPENDGDPGQLRTTYKLGRGNDGRDGRPADVAAEALARGWFAVYHDTAFRALGVPVYQSVVGVGDPILRAIGENNVHVADNATSGWLADTTRLENRWGSSNLQITPDQPYPATAPGEPWWAEDAEIVAGTAVPLPNVNDGGPWGAVRRDKGAVAGPAVG